MKFNVISDRWAQDEVEATFEELEEMAVQFTKDRVGLDDDYQPGPVTVEIVTRNGKTVVVDDTGQIIAEEVSNDTR